MSFGNLCHLLISIHALRVEGDAPVDDDAWILQQISIHALRVEGDAGRWLSDFYKHHFYPRPPGGGRRAERITINDLFISIHALRVEGDSVCQN